MNDGNEALALIDRAVQALAEAKTIQEVKKIMATASAAKVYAQQFTKSKEVVVHATEIKIRAERRLGEMLSSAELNTGAKGIGKKSEVPKENRTPRLQDIGISKKESMRAQKLAALPSKEFESVLIQAKEDGNLSTTRVLKAHQSEKRREFRGGGIDFYPTPAWCVDRLLEYCGIPGGFWLEPAVGDGSIVQAVNRQRSDIKWTTVDIRKECQPDRVGDFLKMGIGQQFSAVVTNPPYSKALEFVKSAMPRADLVVMLLRLNWLASADRCSWLRSNMPSDVYVLPDRPSFDGEGTDAQDYAWFAWRRSHRGDQQARLTILETTPVKERRGD